MDIGGKLSLSFGNFLMLTALSRQTDVCVPLPQSAPTPSISTTWSPILNPIGSYIRTACVTPSGLNMRDTPCTQRKKTRVVYQDWGFPALGKRKCVSNPEVSQPLVSEELPPQILPTFEAATRICRCDLQSRYLLVLSSSSGGCVQGFTAIDRLFARNEAISGISHPVLKQPFYATEGRIEEAEEL